MNRLAPTQEEQIYLLKHVPVFLVTYVIGSKPPGGQVLGKVHRFFHLGLIQAENQEGLQWRPRVGVVPLLAGVVQGGRSATCVQIIP